uniref:G_PROTEIN_RECEP_F1_2 domain-containing protein n=1 Tax=Panagrellus redivivus TaxID=6233 RepID=A0A7E4V3R7_PANRE
MANTLLQATDVMRKVMSSAKLRSLKRALFATQHLMRFVVLAAPLTVTVVDLLCYSRKERIIKLVCLSEVINLKMQQKIK